MTVRLEELLAAATPGPWRGEVDSVLWSDEFMVGGFEKWHDAELAALAPDAVRLLIDMGEALRYPGSAECGKSEDGLDGRDHRQCFTCDCNALLARLDRLGNTT